ncbi:MAG TPA: SH3 domain-containing protein [Oscillospiraceae bacterium]|nr:SH3 domain-containing protein [Oscillospiraceae bacterium]
MPLVYLSLSPQEGSDPVFGCSEGNHYMKCIADAIARTLVLAPIRHLQLPFLVPGPERAGTVRLKSGSLNIRGRPSTGSGRVVARAYHGAKLRVLSEWQGWDAVDFDGVVGFAKADYIA